MKKYLFLLFLMALISIPQFTHAQATRLGSCANYSDGDRIYITVYGAPGFGKYKFSPLGGISEQSYLESKTLSSLQGGITVHYRFERFNLGVGAVYHQMKGEMDEALLNNAELTLKMRKAFLSLEVPFYSDSFFDFGWGINAGAFMAEGHYYEDPKTPVFAETGLYYNLILNSFSSIMTKVYYGRSYFNTSLNSAVSDQLTWDLSAQIGIRFWF